MALIKYSELRRGMVVLEEGQLCQVLDRDLKTPGNLPSKLTIKFKNLKTGFVIDKRVHPEDRVEQAFLETRDFQYLYKDGDDYVFMDKETYDQISLNKEWVGDQILYPKENEDAKVTFHDSKALSLELPNTVELKVIDTEPAIKGSHCADVNSTSPRPSRRASRSRCRHSSPSATCCRSIRGRGSI